MLLDNLEPRSQRCLGDLGYKMMLLIYSKSGGFMNKRKRK